MEKFPADLNKALGDFDFSRDISEEASQSTSASCDTRTDQDINLLLDCDSIPGNIEGILKPDSGLDSAASINHFYLSENLSENKVQPKFAQLEGALTIHNDISQKLLQKIQNENIHGKQQNVDPVSNSFCNFSNPNYSLLDDPVNCNTDLLGPNPPGIAPPQYENILLPVKLDSFSKSLIDDPEPIYENVYIGTDIPKTNINILQPKLPETTKDLEIPAKKVNEETTRLVFQNVQLPKVPEPKQIVGFKVIDDMSEEELSRYIADLEAQERAKEIASATYENVQAPATEVPQEDEDANEAPIFESVTIGEMPIVLESDLQEKTKKFPVIDYGQPSVSGGEIKKVEEKNTKSSDDQNLEANSASESNKTETISRFSVAMNVDINDKLGSKCKPIQSTVKRKSTESLDNSENDVRVLRPQSLSVVSNANASENSCSELEDDSHSGRGPSPDASENSSMDSELVLGKQPPFWVPDADAPNCMLCDVKFTVIKRRHHCRACGKVLCNKCCNMKYRLEYQGNIDSRVCTSCYQVLTKAESENVGSEWAGAYSNNTNNSGINSPQQRKKPDPHNPMEYCSTIPPLQQLAGNLPPPPSVMVPVGVLKREGSTKQRAEGPKSVMFSDGIRPGCDLTELDTSWDWKTSRKSTPKRSPYREGAMLPSKENFYPTNSVTNSYVPQEPNALPPTVTFFKGQTTYQEVTDFANLYTLLTSESESPITFAINRNLYAHVKIINLSCCVNRICWNITSKGLACVGQDELIFLIEVLPEEKDVPRDILLHINQIYLEAVKGNTITEFGMSIHQDGNLLNSREHAGFLFIRQTLQCLQKIILPPAPYLFGLLVHRWETPWAKVFPLRLVLRLGAEYRYYPCPLVSVRFRDAVYFEIGHTIMKVLADFRNFAYTVPKVQGLTIHMQDRTTHVRFPKNRYSQVIKGLNNSNDHVLAFASNFSIQADSHLVCMQTNSEDESSYQTQAINIQNKPRKVTGASFIVINGALKSSMGLSAKSSILEDGLMVQIMPEKMEALKAALKNMQDFVIGCGHQGAPEPDEVVNIEWVENDTQFNLGVKSPIDGKLMDGIPSIRVHNGVKCIGSSRLIRWTEVFIIKSDDDQPFGIQCPVDINKLSEAIARATCAALVKLLDLLANAGLTKIAVRTTIHPDDVGYEAGSEGMRLPPLYMKSLDNELIKVLQKAVQGCEDTYTILELIFYVLETEKMCVATSH